jgi:hypothetical protein
VFGKFLYGNYVAQRIVLYGLLGRTSSLPLIRLSSENKVVEFRFAPVVNQNEFKT